jgi:hypothetical protein
MSYENVYRVEDQARRASSAFWVVMAIGCLSFLPLFVGLIASENSQLSTLLNNDHLVFVLTYGALAAGIGSSVILLKLSDYIAIQEVNSIKERKHLAMVLHPTPTEYASSYMIAQARKKIALQEIQQQESIDHVIDVEKPKRIGDRTKSSGYHGHSA